MKLLYSSLLLLLSAAAAPAHAQNTRTWTDVRALGRGTQFMTHAVVDAAGNFYEAGYFNASTVVDGVTLTSRGGGDGYLAKYTPAGTLAWVRQIGSTSEDGAVDVAVDAAGNVYVVGATRGTLDFGNGVVLPVNGLTQGFVARYSPQGTATWVVGCQVAGSATISASSIGVDGAGQVYVTGLYRGTLTVGSATVTAFDDSAYLLRLSSAGAVQWLQPAFTYVPAGFTATYAPQLAVGVGGETYLCVASDVPLGVAGTTYPSIGRADGYAIRYSAQGTPQWVRQYGSTGNETMSRTAVDAAGNLYLCGSFAQTMRFGATTITTRGVSDSYLVKYSPTGQTLWSGSGGSSSNDDTWGLTVDADGNAYLTGAFYRTARFGSFVLSGSLNDYTAMVVAFDPSGTVRWAETPQGNGRTVGWHLGLDANNGLHLLGRANGLSTWSNEPLVVTSSTDATFIARLSNVLVTRSATAARQSLAFYPSPAHDQLHLPALPALPAGTPVQLTDALGRVARTTVVSATSRISVQGLTPGLYTLRATDAKGRQVAGKVVVE
ncbi:T9SS type A sorting domain-containing protein [Hymenobacter cellulosivorans]|uniref:T9SS type A sorting domain-containing protein n=1 Tax=Hymenobacter cellulosivorans TaxID=2932249 RepID=A0ABY4F6D6_9BACT|nr:T9SS type A sorting domain-containing protein [Hymenobacter cellulosivorans]UOQ52225.1 T9SS type A sorting domain-containing protein [Hymenobacter cellulosivorans]